MIRPARTRWPFLVLLFFGICVCHSWVFAQAGVRIRVSDPITAEFPKISLTVSITDDSGKHVPDLTTQNFTIIEDSVAIEADTVEEQILGTQQIFILNSSRGLRGRDALGFTRYDYVRNALIDWWGLENAATIDIDDLSLMSLDNNLVIHSSLAAELSAALSEYEPDFQEEFASFDLLLEALDISADTMPGPDRPTLIFFITPLINQPQDFPLANTISWAKENGVIIYPILVLPDDLDEFPEVDNLELLAETTGGELILFDPDVGLTPFAEKILTQRMQYEISYTSQINSIGPHTLQVRLTSDGLDAISDPVSFSMNISEPEVIIINPPDHIRRETDDPNLAVESIPPLSTMINVLVTFPDGYPREISSSQLIVDDQVESTHNQPPFDSFVWDLSSYEESGSHEIVVQVEDSLGLQGSTMKTLVQIEVITPPSGLSTMEPALGTVFVILGILLVAGVFSVGIVTLSRRRQLGAPSTSQAGRGKSSQRQSRSFHRRDDRGLIEATLDPLTEESFPITLIGVDLILGRDASISATPIDDPSVSAMHARLIRLASGDYLIRDQGSVAGTWVNYQAVPERGKILQHGDIIHLGRVIYRFQLSNPPPESRIHVESVESRTPADLLESVGTGKSNK